MRIFAIMTAALALAGCHAATNNAAAPDTNLSTAPSPASPPSAAASTPAPATADCGSGLTGEIDAREFTAVFSPGTGGFGPKELDATKALVTDRVRSAAGMLCASSTMNATKFAPFKRLLIRNAADATEPHVYADASLGRDVLVIEYAFEGPSSAPREADIAGALVCWGDPKSTGCEAEGD